MRAGTSVESYVANVDVLFAKAKVSFRFGPTCMRKSVNVALTIEPRLGVRPVRRLSFLLDPKSTDLLDSSSINCILKSKDIDEPSQLSHSSPRVCSRDSNICDEMPHAPGYPQFIGCKQRMQSL
ncbi:hypothetical protein B296_00024081 [Ensete ventricosum]|uniref:Uncharacterized protein n=1 Tax=Ensete ventricosum TaxID=4639 RepID=A0A427AKV6_ENSVE|nr:hypothetical protein B296_00024081 [Ensete ventricosum]